MDEEVDILQAEISSALSLKKGLENEITQIVESLGPNPSGSISVLPIELLGDIFHSVVVANPRHIGRLMLVCRFWSQFIPETPRLWSKLWVTVTRDRAELSRCISYCHTCVERSAGCPLDIIIDFRPLALVDHTLWNPVREIVREIGGRYISTKLLSRGDNKDDDDIYQYHNRLYFKPLEILRGHKGETMARWRSFDFSSGSYWRFKKPSFLRAALHANLFTGNTPLLESLAIRHWDWYESYPNMDREIAYLGKSMPNMFLHTPRLKNLILDHIVSPKSHLDVINALQIKRLEFMCDSLVRFKFMLRCRNIVYLKIDFDRPAKWFPDDLKGNEVYFPHLAYLKLDGHFPVDFLNRIAAPSLTTIAFWDVGLLDRFREDINLPETVSRVELSWFHIDSQYDYKSWVKGAIRRFIQSPFVEILVCQVEVKAEVEEALVDLKEVRGKLLRTLLVMPSVPYDHLEDLAPLEVIDLS